jgi:hypothetical protein
LPNRDITRRLTFQDKREDFLSRRENEAFWRNKRVQEDAKEREYEYQEYMQDERFAQRRELAEAARQGVIDLRDRQGQSQITGLLQLGPPPKGYEWGEGAETSMRNARELWKEAMEDGKIDATEYANILPKVLDLHDDAMNSLVPKRKEGPQPGETLERGGEKFFVNEKGGLEHIPYDKTKEYITKKLDADREKVRLQKESKEAGIEAKRQEKDYTKIKGDQKKEREDYIDTIVENLLMKEGNEEKTRYDVEDDARMIAQENRPWLFVEIEPSEPALLPRPTRKRIQKKGLPKTVAEMNDVDFNAMARRIDTGKW